MSFISYLKDGISLGSIYAIIALGYTMVYGIAKMLNFAHGDVIMVGAFVILTAVTKAKNLSPSKPGILLSIEHFRCTTSSCDSTRIYFSLSL